MASRARVLLALSTLPALAGCPSASRSDASVASDAAMDGAVSATDDVVDDLATAVDDAAVVVDASRPPVWTRELPPSSAWQPGAGRASFRAIVHAHSVHSHDACDGNPYVDGGPNEPCLQSFRAALCRTRVDVVFLTEHSALMAEGPFERVMQPRSGDEPAVEDGRTVGYRVACPSGHRVLVLPGAENELMPLALLEHPRPVAGRSLIETYRTADQASVERFREAGGFVVVSHAEQKPLALTLSLRPDGIELYNVHANLDPRIAGPYLDVDIGGFFADVGRFTIVAGGAEPDLLFLGFFRENVPDFVRLSALWRAGNTTVGVGASDAHENSIPRVLADGERGDSYRRVFRWFSNELLVDGALTRASALASLRAARARVRFEAWGVAEGFTNEVVTGATRTIADGATVSLASAPVIEASAPVVYGLDPSLPRPAIRVRVLRADESATGWTEVATDPVRVRYTPTEPGVFRVEADITPNHVRPYLPRLERYVREVPWVYAAPLRIVN